MAETKTQPYDQATSVLGYAQITSSQGSITSLTDVTGLSATVTIPTLNTGQKIKVSAHVHFSVGVANDTMSVRINEGATVLQTENITSGGEGTAKPSVILTPTAGSHTYKIQAARGSGTGTETVIGASTQPSYIKVEII